MVESRCGAAALGRTYLLPALSSGGASVVRPWLRFHTPLIEPDMQVSRIRLSDKTSRLHPRHVAPKRAQAYKPEVPVKVREWMRSLPSTGITRLRRYYEPLRHPGAPGLSLAGIRLVIAGHASGLPVLRTLSLCTCCRHYPGAAAGRILAHSPSRISLPRKGRRVGLRIVLFEACSAFTRG